MPIRKKKKVINRPMAQSMPTLRREVFPEGDWVSIKEDLALMGWDAMHREVIHNHLQSGLPLSLAVKNVAKNIGACPINSRIFFQASSY